MLFFVSQVFFSTLLHFGPAYILVHHIAMSGRGKSCTIYMWLKPISQASASVPVSPGVEPAPYQMNPDADPLKLNLLSSLKEDIP